MPVGVLFVHLQLPGCNSLKEKRSLIKPVIARLHREFNVSVAEMDLMDKWRECILGVGAISNDANQAHRELQQVLRFIEQTWPDIQLIDQRIEMI